MSDDTGAKVAGSEARYLPFGDYRGTPPTTNPSVTDRGYTGHKENRDIGLTYMNARFYIPGIGRFASADTIVPNPINPQSFNRYSYVFNSPLQFIDPTGHIPRKCNHTRVTSSVCYDAYDGETGIRASDFDKADISGFTAGAYNTITMIPYADTPEDIMVASTGCGTSCQLGLEEPVGPGWRAVAAVGVILPGGYRLVRSGVNGVSEGLSLVRRLIRHGDELADLPMVPRHVLDNALSDFNRADFYADGEAFSITRERMGHFLSRHHPNYWGAWSGVGVNPGTHGPKSINTAFDAALSVDEVANLAQQTVQLGYDNRTYLSPGTYEYVAEIGGKPFRAITENSKIVMFHPLPVD